MKHGISEIIPKILLNESMCCKSSTILNISYVNWKKTGYSKRTLYHMKQNVNSDKLFTLEQKRLFFL